MLLLHVFSGNVIFQKCSATPIYIPKNILSEKLFCSIAVLSLCLKTLKKIPIKEFYFSFKCRTCNYCILKNELFHSLFFKLYEHNWAKPHIFVMCPFRNYYPILFQLDTWHNCGNCFKLMLWIWCQCFRSIFFNFTVWKSLDNPIRPKIDNFWQFLTILSLILGLAVYDLIGVTIKILLI